METLLKKLKNTLGLSSYPTYEEWKHFKEARSNFWSGIVLILPMRNGNRSNWRWNYDSKKVLILPMRNGNFPVHNLPSGVMTFLSYLWGMETRYRKIDKKHWSKVLILPMRNGNSSTTTAFKKSRISVLILPMRNGNWGGCSKVSGSFSFLSYLWGMETSKTPETYVPKISVLILPMRNGNSFPS